jgi:uncharacterized protein with HEPN domain
VSRDWWLFLDDMIASCEKVRHYTQGMSRDDFFDDDRTYDAVVRNLEIIGEASKRLPEDVKQRMPGIEWRDIAAMRDLLAHVYFGIDDQILWNVISIKVGELEESLSTFRDGEAEDEGLIDGDE